MDTNKKENQSTKKNAVLPIAILVVVSLMIIAFLLANNSFDFLDFMLRLHGG